MRKIFIGKANGRIGIFIAMLSNDNVSAHSFGMTSGVKEWIKLREHPQQPLFGLRKWDTLNYYPRYTLTIFPLVFRYQKLDLKKDVDKNKNV